MLTAQQAVNNETRKDRHFNRLKETTDAVWPIILGLIEEQYKRDKSSALRGDMQLFLEKREKKLLLRPYLARLAYELAGGKDWTSILKLLAAVELFNISTYQSNICFDQKADFRVSQPENQFIASMFSLSLAQIAISEQQGMTAEAKSMALELLARCNIEVYEGQFIDINLLSLDRLRDSIHEHNESGLDRPKKYIDNFMDEYLHRCTLIGGATFVVTAIGAIAANGTIHLTELLKKCYRKFGVAAQIINDLADYIPDEHQTKDTRLARPYTNSYGDLRMGRLTYPTYLLCREPDTAAKLLAIQKRWQRLVPTDDELIVFTNALRKMNIRGKSERLIRTKTWNGKDGIRLTLADLEKISAIEAFNDLLFIRSFIFGSSMLLYFQNHSTEKLNGQ
jgi:geranylgeranyl pyrophosphate synthase